MTTRTWLAVATLALLTLVGACGGDDPEQSEPAAGGGPAEQVEGPDAIPSNVVEQAAEAIGPETLLANIRTLSSDAYEGRAPGGAGEDSTVAHLTAEFQTLGLAPGNPDGTWVQEVPLVAYTAEPAATVDVGGTSMPLAWPAEYVAVSRRFESELAREDSELVFVGYGVDAPEYDWNDYGALDATGKTLVMLINDPPVPHPDDPSRLDEDMFRGEAMTYYGRWTYKYEIGAERGADAVIVIHETGPAGYPWEVLQNARSGEIFDIAPGGDGTDRLAVEAFMPEPVARRVLSAAGQDFDALKEAARSPDFEPVPLDATIDWSVRTETRDVRSRNVVARLEGSDPAFADEHVVYTAHWDHLGRDAGLAGDQIFNGALDNASGTAGLIELARAFRALSTPPARSVLFLAVTAEEQGLLGAKHYAENPLYPLETTLANINLDGLNQWGRTEDVVVVGYGNSELDDLLTEAAQASGRTVEPDPEPEKGFFYRSDHFEFAKQGVPALYVDAGTRFVGKPEGYGAEKRDEYTEQDYHQVSDEVKEDWDLTGAVDDLRLLFRVGLRITQAERYPEWKPGTEFRAVRQQMLGQPGN